MAEENIRNEAPEETPEQLIERKNLLSLIKEWPMPRKIALGAIATLCVILFAILIIEARTADYQLLYANLGETDAASVVNWLKAQHIPYQLKNGGKNIWIPSDQLYETRLNLASNGLPAGGGVGFEIFDKQSFALTDYVQKVNYTRALQGELSRTIASLSRSKVHGFIWRCPKRPFLRTKRKRRPLQSFSPSLPAGLWIKSKYRELFISLPDL